MKALPIIAAAVMVATSAAAAERSGFYVGGDVGGSDWDITSKDSRIFTDAISDYVFSDPAVTSVSATDKYSNSDVTYSLFVGYQFVPWLAAELAWLDLGSSNIKTNGTYDLAHISPLPVDDTTTGVGGYFSSNPKVQSAGGAISLLPMWPISHSWDLYGRIGYYFGSDKLKGKFYAQDLDQYGDPIPDSAGGVYTTGYNHTTDTSSFLWGVGVQWTLAERVSLRAEYGQVLGVDVKGPSGTSSPDVTRYTLGVAYRFGHVEEAAPVVAAAPVAAAPVVAAKCADSDKDGVCDTADKCPNTPAGDRVGPNGCSCDITLRTHFAFDSAELTAEDKAALDKAAARLKELNFVEGTATGHTDSVGEEAYNQKLSERRAQAVVDYLAAQGVAPGRIKAIGMGEAKPIASNDTEEGRAENRRVTIRRTDCGPAN